MALNWKKAIDRNIWASLPPLPNIHAAGGCICADLRKGFDRNPFVYQLASNLVLNRHNIYTKGTAFAANPSLSVASAGSAMKFAPSNGLKGAIAVGATTTSIPTSTVITAVGVNMLANRGGSGDRGFKIRIIGKVSGKTEERLIVANTGGTTPTIILDTALSFTPATGDLYEILAGRVFMLGSGVLSQSWKSLEVATNNLANLTTTNLPATIATDSDFFVLDEQYVPYNHAPGEGFVKGSFLYDTGLNALAATAIGASSITGQATNGDVGVLANEYRNFQIRIVQDTANPTAVGQRGIIASHTAGASPVYTMGAAWGVLPSSSAKFVIEYPNLILLRSSGTLVVYTYNYNDYTINNGTNSITAGTWHVTYFGNAPAVNGGGGLWMGCHGIQPDAAKNARHSHLFFARGGAVPTIDLLDIAGSITGTWTTAIVYDGAVNFPVGTSGCQAPHGNEGKFFYLDLYVASAINQLFRFDVKNRVLSPYTPTDTIQSGVAVVGNRMASYCAIDGTDNYNVLLLLNHLSTIAQEIVEYV